MNKKQKVSIQGSIFSLALFTVATANFAKAEIIIPVMVNPNGDGSFQDSQPYVVPSLSTPKVKKGSHQLISVPIEVESYNPATPQNSFQDRDCKDFKTQKEAQSFFNQFSGDPHKLDRDNDGIACEHL
jgi:hypothetical protein